MGKAPKTQINYIDNTGLKDAATWHEVLLMQYSIEQDSKKFSFSFGGSLYFCWNKV
ncbi:hypothetical protein COLO4_36905 [Corchorus olitorius]|uniref:Uncharacterized protein n=1 Tax=Corchorus olitorius TaxID=93759 RepID=A0A1R3G4H2_9ROSI|nr:hypothetical protein COLO4_36905 [Corchorus olitorius]